MIVKLKCVDCGAVFEVDDDKPLGEQIDTSIHIWNTWESEKNTGCQLRHRTENDHEEYDW